MGNFPTIHMMEHPLRVLSNTLPRQAAGGSSTEWIRLFDMRFLHLFKDYNLLKVCPTHPIFPFKMATNLNPNVAEAIKSKVATEFKISL